MKQSSLLTMLGLVAAGLAGGLYLSERGRRRAAERHADTGRYAPPRARVTSNETPEERVQAAVSALDSRLPSRIEEFLRKRGVPENVAKEHAADLFAEIGQP